MEPLFKLYWLRNNGVDRGTLISGAEIHPMVQDRVLQLANGESAVFDLRLPYMDDRDLRHPMEAFEGLQVQRRGLSIEVVAPERLALRSLAAECVWNHPAWEWGAQAPSPFGFRAWRRVSEVLQRAMRSWIADAYFADLSAFQNRDAAYTMLVYQVARVYRSRQASQLTFDLHEYMYPERLTQAAWKLTGAPMRRALLRAEGRLLRAGQTELAQHYCARWKDDVIRTVRQRPRRFADLLIRETEFVNALIDLGLTRNVAALTRFTRTANYRLQNVQGMDMRHLGIRALELVTETLQDLHTRSLPTARNRRLQVGRPRLDWVEENCA